jgi:hypothetical protein
LPLAIGGGLTCLLGAGALIRLRKKSKSLLAKATEIAPTENPVIVLGEKDVAMGHVVTGTVVDDGQAL